MTSGEFGELVDATENGLKRLVEELQDYRAWEYRQFEVLACGDKPHGTLNDKVLWRAMYLLPALRCNDMKPTSIYRNKLDELVFLFGKKDNKVELVLTNDCGWVLATDGRENKVLDLYECNDNYVAALREEAKRRSTRETKGASGPLRPGGGGS